MRSIVLFIVVTFVIGCILVPKITSATQFTHNISVDSVLAPPNNSHVGSDSIPVRIRFTNRGGQFEFGVKVTAEIEVIGKIIYRDTVIITTWADGEILDISFKSYTLYTNQKHTLRGIALLPSDEHSADDTAISKFTVWWDSDVQAVSLLLPLQNSKLPSKISFVPSGSFRWIGEFNKTKTVPVRVQIRWAGDDHLVFKTDTEISSLDFYDGDKAIQFPSQQGIYNIRTLPPGAYKAAIMSLLPDDGDRTNDTAFSYFDIVDNKLQHDISVDSILSPRNQQNYPIAPLPIIVRVTNAGLNKGTNVIVMASIKGPDSTIIYADTAYVIDLDTSTIEDVHFKDFVIPKPRYYYGPYKLCITAISTNDEYVWNDTISSSFTVGPKLDIAVLSALAPTPNEIKQAGIVFKPTALLQANWGAVKNIALARIEIRTYDNNILVFQADTATPALRVDSEASVFSFPTIGRINTDVCDIRFLRSGWYKLIVIVPTNGDNIPGNDTAVSVFKVEGMSIDNEVSVDSILYPLNHSRLTRTPQTIKVRVSNQGLRDQNEVIFNAGVYANGKYYYLDENVSVKNFKSGESRDISFSPFTPKMDSLYRVRIGIYYAYNDLWHFDDTLSSFFTLDTLSSVKDEMPSTEKGLQLHQNFPNPFSTSTTVSYTLPENGFVSIRIFDMVGNLVRTVVSKELTPGSYSTEVNSDGLASGIYTYEMSFTNPQGKNQNVVRTMGILK
jgi:hypothetical protein